MKIFGAITAYVPSALRLCCAVLLIVTSIGIHAQNHVYYRYTDNKGYTVISSQIPPQYIGKGYDVIDKSGKLIRRVEPEPSAEEKARRIKEEAERKHLTTWDAGLLRRYSHPDDIEEAKQRKLVQNKNFIEIINRNIEKIDIEIDRYQSLAAADEREGRNVSQDTLTRIQQLKVERNVEIKSKKAKEKEREGIEKKFDEDIDRFKIIRPNRR